MLSIGMIIPVLDALLSNNGNESRFYFLIDKFANTSDFNNNDFLIHFIIYIFYFCN